MSDTLLIPDLGAKMKYDLVVVFIESCNSCDSLLPLAYQCECYLAVQRTHGLIPSFSKKSLDD